MRKAWAWIFTVLIAVGQFFIISSGWLDNLRTGTVLLYLLLIYLAPVIAMLILLLIYAFINIAKHDVDFPEIRHHMFLSITTMTVLMSLGCIVWEFAQYGFWEGFLSILVLGVYSAAAILLTMLIFGERDYGGYAPSSSSSNSDSSYSPSIDRVTPGDFGNCLPCHPCSPDQIRDGGHCLPCHPCSPDQIRSGSNCLPCHPCSPDQVRDGSQCLPCHPCSPDQVRDGKQCLPCHPCSPDQLQ